MNTEFNISNSQLKLYIVPKLFVRITPFSIPRCTFPENPNMMPKSSVIKFLKNFSLLQFLYADDILKF